MSHPVVYVSIMVINPLNSATLLVKSQLEPHVGKWVLPYTTIGAGSTWQDALSEATGKWIGFAPLADKISLYTAESSGEQLDQLHLIAVHFADDAAMDQIKTPNLGGQASELAWVHEVESFDFAYDSHVNAIEKFYDLKNNSYIPYA